MGQYRNEADKMSGYATEGDVPMSQDMAMANEASGMVGHTVEVVQKTIDALSQAIEYNETAHAELEKLMIKNLDTHEHLVTQKKRAIRSRDALTGSDETVKPLEGTSIRAGMMGRAVEGTTYNG